MLVLSGLVAAAFGFLELSAGRNWRFSWRGLHLVILRLGIDSLAAVVAFRVIAVAVRNSETLNNPIFVVLAAGLSGPAILRSQFLVVGKGANKTPVGLMWAHQYVTSYVERKLNRINATAQEDWLSNRVLPALSVMSIVEIRKRTLLYVSRLDLPPKDISSEAKLIRETLDRNGSSDEDKCEELVKHLLDSGGEAFLRSLVRAAKKARAKGAADGVQATKSAA